MQFNIEILFNFFLEDNILNVIQITQIIGFTDKLILFNI